MYRKFLLVAIWVLLLTACVAPTGGASSVPNSPQQVPIVVSSTTFLADIARNVTGDRLIIESLLPAGADPHGYQPVPADVVKIEKSTVLIINGLGYEHFLAPVLENAGGSRLIITASEGLEQREVQEESGETVTDPHMWLDVNRVIKYVENIRDGLVKADPGGADSYKANADVYISQLKDLDAWISEQVAQIPAERRLLVTNHEALGYFAERYGFQVVGTVLRSVSSEVSVSAQELSDVVDEIKAAGVPAIFLDEVENENLARQIAEETGVVVVDDLHLESLTDGPPAQTYLEMMQHNAARIVDALK